MLFWLVLGIGVAAMRNLKKESAILIKHSLEINEELQGMDDEILGL